MEDNNGLKQFLKQNQPIPPGAPPHELEQILARVNAGKRRRVWQWAAAIAVAASLILVLIFQEHQRETNAVADFEIGDEAVPTLEVGEEYLEIVAGY